VLVEHLIIIVWLGECEILFGLVVNNTRPTDGCAQGKPVRMGLGQSTQLYKVGRIWNSLKPSRMPLVLELLSSATNVYSRQIFLHHWMVMAS
jgi:hypothetical protein